MKNIIIILLLIPTFCFSQTREEYFEKVKNTEKVAVELVDKQIEGYNNRDIEEFLEPYSDSVKVFDFGKGVDFQGKGQMRIIYEKLFKDYPDLNCKIQNRIVYGNTVVDQELVNFSGYEVNAVAIYVIQEKKISEVHFVQPLE